MDVCEWLKGLRLGQYEATFRAQEIEANVVADLTEGALEEIGLPLAARKRLMRVIADLGSSASSPPRTEPKSDAMPTTALADAAERRNITVMFCDLIGSTGLAAGLDAEDWRSLNQRLSRRGLGGGDRARPPCAEKAWRRADDPLWLSAGARTTPSERCGRRSRSSEGFPTSTLVGREPFPSNSYGTGRDDNFEPATPVLTRFMATKVWQCLTLVFSRNRRRLSLSYSSIVETVSTRMKSTAPVTCSIAGLQVRMRSHSGQRRADWRARCRPQPRQST